MRLREAHFQGRAPAVVRRVRGHRRIDARPVHRRRPTSGPVVGASLNTAIFRGWSFLATPPQGRLELARIGWPRLLLCQRLAARANDGIDVTVPREVRTALQRNECRTGNRGCYLTPEPVRHGTVVATVYDRRRLADEWKVGANVEPIDEAQQRGCRFCRRRLALQPCEAFLFRGVCTTEEDVTEQARAESPMGADRRHDRVRDPGRRQRIATGVTAVQHQALNALPERRGKCDGGAGPR